MNQRIDNPLEFAFIFGVPYLAFSPLIIVLMYFLVKAYSGEDQKMNEASEGNNFLMGTTIIIAICSFFGTVTLSLYYGLDDEINWWAIFGITALLIIGAAGKGDSNMIHKLLNLFSRYGKKPSE